MGRVTDYFEHDIEELYGEGEKSGTGIPIARVAPGAMKMPTPPPPINRAESAERE